MKRLCLFITAVLLAITVCANTRQGSKSQKLYIIDGYFFNEIPMNKTLITGLIPLNTPGGAKATALTLSQPLPDEALRYALPVEQVPDAEQFLMLYNEKKSGLIPLAIKPEETLKTGDLFPPFKAVDINGQTWTNEDVKDKVMVLNCWFTGCGPCRAEMPELSGWKDEIPDVIFFSSTYEDADTARQVLEKAGFNWTPIVNDNQFKTYVGGNGYPMTVVIDKSGIIRQVEFGTSPLQRDHLKQTIQSLR